MINKKTALKNEKTADINEIIFLLLQYERIVSLIVDSFVFINIVIGATSWWTLFWSAESW